MTLCYKTSKVEASCNYITISALFYPPHPEVLIYPRFLANFVITLLYDNLSFSFFRFCGVRQCASSLPIPAHT